MQRLRRIAAATVPLVPMVAVVATSGPLDLTDRFELPPGFHIYSAAGPELSGGSYALTFDGEGRLLEQCLAQSAAGADSKT